jgi:hypothetical protein
MPDVLTIADAEPLEDHLLRVTFGTGEVRVVDVKPVIDRVGGPVFEPLRDADYFARVSVDPLCGTVVWPNGADLAPTALHVLPDLSAVSA